MIKTTAFLHYSSYGLNKKTKEVMRQIDLRVLIFHYASHEL